MFCPSNALSNDSSSRLMVNKQGVHIFNICLLVVVFVLFFIHLFIYFFKVFCSVFLANIQDPLFFNERKNKDMFWCSLFSVISFNFIIILSFNKHVHNLSNKESQQTLKLAAIERTCPFMGLTQRRNLTKAYFLLQFLYSHWFRWIIVGHWINLLIYFIKEYCVSLKVILHPLLSNYWKRIAE